MPNDILQALMSPPFIQVLMISAAMLCVTWVSLRIFKIRDPRIRSLYFCLVLFAPLSISLVFVPRVFDVRPILSVSFIEGLGMSVVKVGDEVSVNYTGLLCVVGLVFGAVTLALSYIFGVWIVKKVQDVLVINEDDEPTLYQLVSRVASKLEVDTPTIGLTESLQPNAFTVGYGRKAMVIFSSGLIQTLTTSELEAVAAHEIAHIKNGDFHLMALVSSVKIATFFNPLSYLTASMLAREREYLADEVGSKATHKKNLLQRALVKIATSSANQGGNMLADLMSSLFVYSQIGSLRATFASHPSLDTRLSRISGRGSSLKVEKYKAVAVGIVLVGSMLLLSSYIMQPKILIGEVSQVVYMGFGVDLTGDHSMPPFGFIAIQPIQIGLPPPPPFNGVH